MRIMRRLAAALCALALTVPAHAGIVLEASTDALELVTTTTAAIDYDCSWTDSGDTTFVPGRSQGQIASATTTTVIAAPAASTRRNVIDCSFSNVGAAPNVITVQRDVSGANRVKKRSITLAPGEVLEYGQNSGWRLTDMAGRSKEQATEISGYSGRSFEMFKGGTASEAVGIQYAYLKDGGSPSAWVPGTPGLNGAVTNCSTTAGATIAGAPVLPDPASGAWYLSSFRGSASVANFLLLADLTWYNTGIVPATLGAQAIVFPTPAARDDSGTTNGQGINAALYVTATTGNAGAVLNTTLSYTDQDGNAGNTAVMTSFPATAVAGTFVPFSLAAGDTGIRSIQSITLGTSYVSGSVSLVTYRTLGAVPNPVVNVGGIMTDGTPWNPGVRMFNGTCLFMRYISSATTATNTTAVGAVMER